MVAAVQTFQPSLFALGENRYLSSRHFFTVMALVFGLHLLVGVISALLPDNDVVEIPVRSLNIKLGDYELAPAPLPPVVEPIKAEEPPKVAQDTQPKVKNEAPPAQKKAASKESFVPPPVKKTAKMDNPTKKKAPEKTVVERPLKKKEVKKVKTPPKKAPAPTPKAAKKTIVKKKVTPKAASPKRVRIQPKQNQSAIAKQHPIPAGTLLKPERPNVVPVNQLPSIDPSQLSFNRAPVPAVIAKPQQFIRENPVKSELAGKQSGRTNGAALSAEAIRVRYEQEISRWLEKHKEYPSSARQLGQHGTPVLRIRIDRQGNVRFAAVDRSTGYELIDQAAMQMVRRANPFPAPPADYPGGRMIEFRIPVLFNLN